MSTRKGHVKLPNRPHNHRNRHTKAERTPPYLRRDFWLNPINHFWETPTHTEAAKEYFRSKVEAMRQDLFKPNLTE